MELPFAVDQSRQGLGSSAHSQSTLVTASSQGSLLDSGNFVPSTGATALLPTTPQDVILPPAQHAPQHDPSQNLVDIDTDFTYVDVSESDTDDLIHRDMNEPYFRKGNILSVLLSGAQQDVPKAFLNQIQEGHEKATKAAEEKAQGNLEEALVLHTRAAKLFRDAANATKSQDTALSSSLILLSNVQAKSAVGLQRIVKLNPTELLNLMPPASRTSSAQVESNIHNAVSQKERLRAAVRGALGSRHPHEADMSDSVFLGRKAVDDEGPSKSTPAEEIPLDNATIIAAGQDNARNPVDEMMELERELRDMDMNLELGSSMMSLDARVQSRMKNSMVDGSFMVVAPGSNSYMSSSMWGAPPSQNTTVRNQSSAQGGTAGVRARANRVQNLSSRPPTATTAVPPTLVPSPAPRPSDNGLESSWWGNSGSASQVLASSIISVGGRSGFVDASNPAVPNDAANTKQIMRLMDALKTLGDENATLLREVEEAEAARVEARAAREQMKRFKEEYGKRFAHLKAALEKFRKEHPEKSSSTASSTNPVSTSDFVRSASESDKMMRQEQLIRKLTSDLKREKEESKKKDAALRKYESFYREVKARSAQKAAQRQKGTHQATSRVRR